MATGTARRSPIVSLASIATAWPPLLQAQAAAQSRPTPRSSTRASGPAHARAESRTARQSISTVPAKADWAQRQRRHQGLNVPFILREEVAPLRMLPIVGTLPGHKAGEFV